MVNTWAAPAFGAREGSSGQGAAAPCPLWRRPWVNPCTLHTGNTTRNTSRKINSDKTLLPVQTQNLIGFQCNKQLANFANNTMDHHENQVHTIL